MLTRRSLENLKAHGICCFNELPRLHSVLHEMQLLYCNSQVHAPPSNPTVEDNLYENTPVHEYDLNSILPAPNEPLRTELVALEPLIVSSIPRGNSVH